MKIIGHDRLVLARLLLMFALALSAGAVILMSLDAVSGPQPSITKTRQLVRQFGLTSPALVSSGHPGRYPDSLSPAVDLRHDPRLPIMRPEFSLFFKAPRLSSDRWAE